MKFIIVLGCDTSEKVSSLNENSVAKETYTVEGMLRGRLEKAYKYYLKNTDSYIIVSGGSEGVYYATGMKTFLIEKGVPCDKILEESSSSNVNEQAVCSLDIIRKIKRDGCIRQNLDEVTMRNLEYNFAAPTPIGSIEKIVIITSKSHLPRTMIIFGYWSIQYGMSEMQFEYLGTYKHHSRQEITYHNRNEQAVINKLVNL